MLQEISIKNFAIIDTITMQFDQGMSILTGETGAGKSIIIDAMNLLLGSRAQTSFVRHGADKAEIEGLFFYQQDHLEIAQQLETLGFENTGELILRREIFANGRSSCRINGVLTPLSNLQAISSFLVDIHGQHDHQELMSSAHHLAMLDEFGDKISPQARETLLLVGSEKFLGINTGYRPPVSQQTYSASEIGERLGISGNKVGRLTKAHNLKTDEYGIWVLDQSAHSSKQVTSFRYFESVVPVLNALIQTAL